MAARTTTRKRTTKKRTTRRPAARSTAKRTTSKRTTKRATTKRTTKKRTAAVAAKPPRLAVADRSRSKSEVQTIIAEHVGISKKEVAAVFETMSAIIKKDLSRSGPGEFKVPGMMKVLVQRKPAVARRRGVNPFTGEEQWFKAKPARNVVKVRPLKGLKDLV